LHWFAKLSNVYKTSSVTQKQKIQLWHYSDIIKSVTLIVLRNKRVHINGKVFQAGTLDIRCFLNVALKAYKELTSLISCGKSFHKEQPFQANDNFPNPFTLENKKRPLSVKEKECSCLSWTLTLNLVLWLWDEVTGLKFQHL